MKLYLNIMHNLTAIFARVIIMGMLAAFIASCAGERPNLGVINGTLQPCPASPNCVSSQATDAGHQIAPLSFSSDPDPAFLLLKQLLSCRRDTKIFVEEVGYVRSEFHTTFFVDDGEFLLDRNLKAINVRSASRIGYSDFGKNRSRMEEIRREFEAAANKRS